MISLINVAKYASACCLMGVVVLNSPFIGEINKRAIINIMYNVVYAISYVQIKVTKLIKIVKDHKLVRGFIEILDNNCNNKIETVKDGHVNFTTTARYNKALYFGVPYDFLIISYIKHSPSIIHKKLLKKYEEKEEMNIEVSTVKFMLIEVIIGDKSFKLDLTTNAFNYYVVNNIIDKYVVTYLMRVQYFYEMKSNHDDVINYVLKIVDNNVDTIDIGLDKSIKILKDSYEIF